MFISSQTERNEAALIKCSVCDDTRYIGVSVGHNATSAMKCPACNNGDDDRPTLVRMLSARAAPLYTKKAQEALRS